jgi:hypothetical protein
MTGAFTKRLIIGGPPRSGTTLVRWVLDASDTIIAGPELGLFVKPWTPDRRFAQKLDEKIDRALGLGRDVIRAEIEDHDDPVRCCDALMARYMERAGVAKHGWAEKTPNNCLRYRELAEARGDLYFLSVVRDPRDVVTSRLEPGSDYYCEPERAVRALRAVSAFEHPRHAVVRYEDIVADPARAFERVFEFLGEPFDPVFLERSRRTGVTRDPARVRQPKVTRPISADWSGRWRDPAHEDRIERFMNEPGAPEVLDAFGYPR